MPRGGSKAELRGRAKSQLNTQPRTSRLWTLVWPVAITPLTSWLWTLVWPVAITPSHIPAVDPGVTCGHHALALLIWEMGAIARMMKVRFQRLIQGSDLVLCEAPRSPWWPWTFGLCSPSSLGFQFEGSASSDLDPPGGQRLWRARGLGEEAVPIEPFCPSRHLLEMRMKLRAPHSQQGGAFASLCSQVLAGVGSFHLFTPLGPAWWNPPSPDAGQSSRRLTTANPPPPRLSTPVVPGSGPSLISAPTTWYWLPFSVEVP